jgi:hypothetical protein
MKAKTPRRKPSLRAWLVVSNGQEVPVEAEHMDIDDGTLKFISGNRTERAWAEGAWTSVSHIPEPPVPVPA